LRAEIIFTGTELLLGQILNTNAQYLQQVLASLGIDLYYQVTVGDNLERLVEAINQALRRADLIIIGGDLGPTEDDLSKEALAKNLNISLTFSEQAMKIVCRLFEERKIPMPRNNLKQAILPIGGIVLDNPIGTAPGIILEHQDNTFALVPGPPNEFKLMIKEQLAPYLKQKLGKQIQSRVLKLTGLGESMVDERLGELLRSGNPTVAPTARFAEVHLRITSKAESVEKARQINASMEEKIRQRLGKYIFGVDKETLADAAGRAFSQHNLTLATVETFTGGLLAYQLTTTSTGAEFFKIGYILGQDGEKWSEPLPAINKREIAEKLAAWGGQKAGTDVCVAITAQEETKAAGKPGATVYIATSGRNLNRTGDFYLWGTKQVLRERSVQTALSLLFKTFDRTSAFPV